MGVGKKNSFRRGGVCGLNILAGLEAVREQSTYLDRSPFSDENDPQIE